jgi:hypothetical protein
MEHDNESWIVASGGDIAEKRAKVALRPGNTRSSTAAGSISGLEGAPTSLRAGFITCVIAIFWSTILERII